MDEMSARELHARLAEAGEPPLLLDVREPWEFDICRIDGARLLPMRQIVSSLGELDPERELVILLRAKLVDPILLRNNRPFRENLLEEQRRQVREILRRLSAELTEKAMFENVDRASGQQ